MFPIRARKQADFLFILSGSSKGGKRQLKIPFVVNRVSHRGVQVEHQ